MIINYSFMRSLWLLFEYFYFVYFVCHLQHCVGRSNGRKDWNHLLHSLSPHQPLLSPSCFLSPFFTPHSFSISSFSPPLFSFSFTYVIHVSSQPCLCPYPSGPSSLPSSSPGESCPQSHSVSYQQHLRVSQWGETHSVPISGRRPLLPPPHHHSGSMTLTHNYKWSHGLSKVLIPKFQMLHICQRYLQKCV